MRAHASRRAEQTIANNSRQVKWALPAAGESEEIQCTPSGIIHTANQSRKQAAVKWRARYKISFGICASTAGFTGCITGNSTRWKPAAGALVTLFASAIMESAADVNLIIEP
jgi:hypothetical protein